MKTILSYVVALLMVFTSLEAQMNPGNFSISAVNSAGLIKVVLTPLNNNVVPPGDTYYNDISFSISWPTSYGNVDIDSTSVISSYNIKVTSRRLTVVNGSTPMYLRTFGRGGSPITQIASGWAANNPITLITVQNNYGGTVAPYLGDFCIVNYSSGISFNSQLNVDTKPNIWIADLNDPSNYIFDDYTPSVNGCAIAVPLPIELVNFEAAPEKEAINLRWQTAKEENFFGFELERSLDGLKFQKIAFISGRGNKKGAFYQYDDLTITKGVNYYYRLKMLDKDGKFEYSGIRSAVLPTSNVNVVIYPNPSNGNVNLDFVLEESTPTIVDVYDMNGRNVLRKEVDAQKDRNIVSLDLLDQPAGIYSVKININGKLITKLVKLAR